MTKLLVKLLLCGPLLSIGVWAKGPLQDKGYYPFDINGVAQALKDSGQDYLSLHPHLALPGATYKNEGIRNEFTIKDWFTYDWFGMQSMFELDVESYIRAHEAQSFNEAKRAQFSQFPFDKKKYLHHKTVPAMREWGGLTHPPLSNIDLPLERYDRSYAPIKYKSIKSPYFSQELQVSIDETSKSELSFGNKVYALMDHKAFEAKKELIKNARDNIFMGSLAFVCEPSTREIVELLIQKKKEGLDVRVMADGAIAKLIGERDCFHLLREEGIEVLETKGGIWGHKLKAIYHAKMLIVDLKKAIAGGHNMLDADNTSRGTDFKNRDMDLYMEGPMVRDMVRQFLENWEYQRQIQIKKNKVTVTSLSSYADQVKRQLLLEREQGLRGQEHYGRILNSEDRMKGVCRIIKQAPYEDRHTIGKAYLKLLDKLENHLVITNPIMSDTLLENRLKLPLLEYFDRFEMFNELFLKIQDLVKVGKKLDMITSNMDMAGNETIPLLNGKIRENIEKGEAFKMKKNLLKLNFYNRYFGGPHYENLIKDWMPHKSVRVWNNIGFVHSKVFYFDRIVASIGSVNFHHNATDQAYESTAICMDEDLNRQLDKIFIQDMANSIPLIFSHLK